MWCEEVIASQKALKRDPLAPEEKRSNHSDHLRSLRSFPISSCFSLRSDGHALAPDREKVGYPAEWVDYCSVHTNDTSLWILREAIFQLFSIEHCFLNWHRFGWICSVVFAPNEHALSFQIFIWKHLMFTCLLWMDGWMASRWWNCHNCRLNRHSTSPIGLPTGVGLGSFANWCSESICLGFLGNRVDALRIFPLLVYLVSEASPKLSCGNIWRWPWPFWFTAFRNLLCRQGQWYHLCLEEHW